MAAEVSAEDVTSSFPPPSSSFLYFYLMSTLEALVVARAVFVLAWTGRSTWSGSCRRRRGPNEKKALTQGEEVEKVTAGNNRSNNEIGSSKTGLMECKECKAHFLKVYRSREVGQSYFTSVGSTLLACVHAAYLVFRVQPDVILCNGPGTCLPVCVAGFLLKVTGLRWVTMIFVESVCRVQKLSLTGILFYKFRLMDQFYVQWESLLQKYPGTIFVGRVM
eukprot:TRINITY_DN1658_c0_g1_i2.p1 TRINITY_DN1658_c0_g1~~TRINITY_DN1658_c0_g1_i2.p1  ORF type:complete len:220 (+),score=17.77 TRINITY_DN1658_c0_g1_i2:91-750(+)